MKRNKISGNQIGRILNKVLRPKITHLPPEIRVLRYVTFHAKTHHENKFFS